MQLSPSQRLLYHTVAVAQRTEAFNPLQSGHQRGCGSRALCGGGTYSIPLCRAGGSVKLGYSVLFFSFCLFIFEAMFIHYP